MMKTRRKSKAAAEEAGTEESLHSLTTSIPEDIDEDVLANILPDVNLTSLAVDDVLELYRTIIAQAARIDHMERERDEVKAELERKDVELDQALQDKETLIKDSEESTESVHHELVQVGQERDQLGTCLFKVIHA